MTAVTAFRQGLLQLHLSDQKIIFNHLPSTVKAALWRDRIQEAILCVDKQQKEVLRQIEERITPEVYDARKRTHRKQFFAFYRQAQPRALALFRSDRKKFVAISTLLGERISAPRIVQGPGLPPCDCSLAARHTTCDDCDEQTNCKRVPCVVTKFGCGCCWMQPCDGVCR